MSAPGCEVGEVCWDGEIHSGPCLVLGGLVVLVKPTVCSCFSSLYTDIRYISYNIES